MKSKILTTINTLMLFIPWTIFPLRTQAWALEMPAAKIVISSYAAFMIFSGIFTSLCYTKGRVQHTWMKLCLVINCLYAVFGVAAFGMMAVSN